MLEGGKFKEPDDGIQPLKHKNGKTLRRQILYFKSYNQVVARHVPIYYLADPFFIQDTSTMAPQYKNNYKYALTYGRYACMGFAFSNDLSLLKVFADAVMESGLDFDNYPLEAHKQYLALKKQYFQIIDDIDYIQCKRSLEMIKKVYQEYKAQKKNKRVDMAITRRRLMQE